MLLFLFFHLAVKIDYVTLMLMLVIFMIYKFSIFFLMFMISMEFLVLVNLFILLSYQAGYMNDWLFLYYLIFAVSESVIGLTLMISMVNVYGNQNMSLLNVVF